MAGIPKKDILDKVSVFCQEHGLQDKLKAFQKGALVAQNPGNFEEIPELTEEDKYYLRREISRMDIP